MPALLVVKKLVTRKVLENIVCPDVSFTTVTVIVPVTFLAVVTMVIVPVTVKVRLFSVMVLLNVIVCVAAFAELIGASIERSRTVMPKSCALRVFSPLLPSPAPKYRLWLSVTTYSLLWISQNQASQVTDGSPGT